jgi:hypothetical protein
VKRSTIDALIRSIIDDLECITNPKHPGWIQRLQFYADRGYPTGSDGVGGSNEINRPTERMALMPSTPPEDQLAMVYASLKVLRAEARKVAAAYHWTVTPAKYDGPEPRPCIVLECDREISMIGSDIARNGRCPRCAQHHRRHGAEYPHKLEQNNARAS